MRLGGHTFEISADAFGLRNGAGLGLAVTFGGGFLRRKPANRILGGHNRDREQQGEYGVLHDGLGGLVFKNATNSWGFLVSPANVATTLPSGVRIA